MFYGFLSRALRLVLQLLQVFLLVQGLSVELVEDLLVLCFCQLELSHALYLLLFALLFQFAKIFVCLHNVCMLGSFFLLGSRRQCNILSLQLSLLQTGTAAFSLLRGLRALLRFRRAHFLLRFAHYNCWCALRRNVYELRTRLFLGQNSDILPNVLAQRSDRGLGEMVLHNEVLR